MKMEQKATKKAPLKEKQKAFAEAYIKNMGNISKACEDVDINRGTYYRWMKRARFRTMYDEAIEKHNDLIFQRILNLALKEDKDMLKFWAKTQMKHRGFVERTELEHSGEIRKLIIEEHVYDGTENNRGKGENNPLNETETSPKSPK